MAFRIETELANGETRELFFCDRLSVMRLVTAEMAHDWVKLALFEALAWAGSIAAEALPTPPPQID